MATTFFLCESASNVRRRRQNFRHQLGSVRGDHRQGRFHGSHGDKPGSGAKRRDAAHRRRAGLAARARDDEHVAEIALVRPRHARPEKRREIRRLDQGQENGRVVLIERRRAPDCGDAEPAGALRVRHEHLPHFRRGEGDAVIGPHGLALASGRIAFEAGWNIDRDRFGQREAVVDFANPIQHAPGGRPFQAGAEQRVDYQGCIAHLREDLGLERAAAGAQHAVVFERLAFQFLGRSRQHHVEGARADAGEELARHHHAVAAVVAFAAQDGDAFGGERRKGLGEKLHHAVARILHQDDARDAQLDGAPVHLAHLGGGEDLHARSPASSGSSLRTLPCSPITTR